VELFAGTVLKLAAKHGIDTPVNKRFYEDIRKTESRY
jgi:ketopantoate reductase